MKKTFALCAAAVFLGGCTTTTNMTLNCVDRQLDEPILHVVAAPPRGFGGKMKRPLVYVQYTERVCT